MVDDELGNPPKNCIYGMNLLQEQGPGTMAASSLSRRPGLPQAIGEDALGPMVAGIATALQCCEDGMGERLASLAIEQSALLAKLEAGREVSPPRRKELRYM